MGSPAKKPPSAVHDGFAASIKKPIERDRLNATDPIQYVIAQAVEVGVRRALNVNEATNRRLFSVEGAAVYLSLSKREVYNMIANGDLRVVARGRRKMLDIRDLDQWIERNKS